MPTILREGPYRFYFYSNEEREPAHVHIDRENRSTKFWLEPVKLACNIRYKPEELKKLNYLMIVNRINFLEAWYAYFGK